MSIEPPVVPFQETASPSSKEFTHVKLEDRKTMCRVSFYQTITVGNKKEVSPSHYTKFSIPYN